MQYHQQHEAGEREVVGMVCKKCGSDKITVQAVTEVKTKKHGLLWWLFIGWWWWTLFFGAALILKLFGRGKVTSKTHNVCVCQNCGYSWKVGKE